MTVKGSSLRLSPLLANKRAIICTQYPIINTTAVANACCKNKLTFLEDLDQKRTQFDIKCTCFRCPNYMQNT